MRTDSRELLAVGLLGGHSHLAARIECLLHRRPSSGHSPWPARAAGFTLFIAALAGSFAPRWIAFAQERAAFEVATIKINPACDPDHQTEKFSPGRLTVGCIKLSNLIQAAYSRFADGKTGTGPHLDIVGAPSWTASARYDINAAAPANTPMEEMFGPMLRSLLEERFRLRTHREIRELPVYTLTTLKSAPKLKAWSEGDCIPVDLKHPNDVAPNFCGMTARANGLHITDEAHGMTMPEIAGRMLTNRLDRPVLDRTGLAGRFNAHLEFDRDSADAAGLSIFTAVQDQLGLKLEAAKGPVEVLVIDHIERPAVN